MPGALAVYAPVLYQLFDGQDAASRAEFTEPEILRSNLSGVLLQLLANGIADPEQLPWLDSPRASDWQQAWRMLDELGAVNEHKRLTGLGRKLSHLPLDPQLARMCLAGIDEGVAHDAITIAAFLSIQDPRLRPLGEEEGRSVQRVFQYESGDVLTVLQCWDAFQDCTSSAQCVVLSKSIIYSVTHARVLTFAANSAYHKITLRQITRDTVARSTKCRAHRFAAPRGTQWYVGMVLMRDEQERCYRAAGNRAVHVHPSSVLNQKRDKGKAAKRLAWPEFLLSCEIIETSRTFARMCAPIDPQWILQLAGKAVKRRISDPVWNAERGRLVVREDITWLGLPIISGKEIPAEQHVGREEAEKLFAPMPLRVWIFNEFPANYR